MPAKSVPARPSLEFDRKAAKALLDAVRQHSASAVERFAEFHPRFPKSELVTADADKLRLADAQLVVAREYGLPSWPRWKQFVDDQLLAHEERVGTMVQALCSQDFRRGARLLEADPSLATTDLYAACACGDLDTVAAELGRDPGAATRAGGPSSWQPILYACYSRFLRRDPVRAEAIVQIVGLLLEGGADANSHYLVDHGDGQLPQTCIYAAAGIANNAELTRLLLEAGADAGERVDGRSANEALYHAAEFADVTCLRLLLEAGPGPKEVSYCLSRALDFDNETAALLFLESGADATLNVPHNHDRTHLHKGVINRRSVNTIRALLDRGADPNRADTDGISPYRFAVRLGYDEIASLLEAHGADLSQVTDEDRAQGSFAPGSRPDAGQLGIVARRGDLELMQKLIAADTPVNREDGMSPLHSACYAGQLAAARLLVEHGADPAQDTENFGTPLSTAIYGSANCCHPEGGPGMLLPEEIDHGDYPGLVEFLIDCGAPLPDRIHGGSEAVQDVLRRYGVADQEGQA